ncbi:MAG: FHA domain-containing protein [Anaerolineales bacterium]|nr:FHA domain-containing protein [Chloroflexota bacterium]MBL6983062.1 FHA domain-containing protein [Anaerolineales bacterium]MBL7163983.1 FHA domain-containing protein [Anaerolineales bacterium]
MGNGKQVTLFALDCGATNWRLYRVGYRLNGNLIRIMGDPQPSPLTSFSERKLPAIFTHTPDGSAIESFGEVSQGQLEDENARERVREYFKPCIGSHLEPNPLPHQKRYTHAQALDFTRMLLEAVVEQIRGEKWRASAFDESVRFAFAYPVHWGYDHGGVILEDFKALVLGCFPEKIHTQIEFVPEPEGAILSLRRQGLLSNAHGGVTLIVDVGGSTTDIIAGQIDPRTGELLYLGRYGEPFGGGLYDAEMAKYLADELNVPASALADDPSAMATLRIYALRLKESLSRRLMQNGNSGDDISAQRMITLVMRDGQVYRSLMKIDQTTFSKVAGHLNQSFQDLIARAIKAIGLTDQDINQVALVGGGVQLFSIVRHLRERFGDEKVVLADNPDEIVVRGVGLAFGAAMGTLKPGVSLVIELPPVAELEEDAEPVSNADTTQDADSVSEVGLQLVSPEEGKAYPLNIGVTKVGRARECLVWLESDKVSRIHAELHRTDESIELIDLGSTNGTFLNDERLTANQTLMLHVGDELRFGDQVFTIKLG